MAKRPISRTSRARSRTQHVHGIYSGEDESNLKMFSRGVKAGVPTLVVAAAVALGLTQSEQADATLDEAEQDPAPSVAALASAGNASESEFRRRWVVFQTKNYLVYEVATGWEFSDPNAPMPDRQYCYASALDKGGSSHVSLGKKSGDEPVERASIDPDRVNEILASILRDDPEALFSDCRFASTPEEVRAIEKEAGDDR